MINLKEKKFQSTDIPTFLRMCECRKNKDFDGSSLEKIKKIEKEIKMELMDLGKVMRDTILMSIVVRQQLSFTPSIGDVNKMGVCVAKDGKEIGEIECDIGKRCLTKDISIENGEVETVLDFIRKTLIDTGDAFAGASAKKGADKKLYVLYTAANIKSTGANRGMPIYN